MHSLVARVAVASVSCFVALMLIAGSVGSATAATQQDDRCASKYIPLIQNAGLDVDKSAPTLGCRPDGNGNWWMPTAASMMDDAAYQHLDSHGKTLLAAIDRMSMDDAFTYSVRYDRANATAITIGPYNRVVETDISDAPMIDGPTWLHNWQEGYEQSLTTYLTRTMGDEDELVAYMYWFITRRDMTVSVLTNTMNPMLANAQRSNWNFQRAPWPWQLVDAYAIAEYTGQNSLITNNDANSPSARGNVAATDGLQASLNVSPSMLRVEPLGSAHYRINSLFWGDWLNAYPNAQLELTILLPSGVTMEGEPLCIENPPQSDVDTAICNSTATVKVSADKEDQTQIRLLASISESTVRGLTLPLRFGYNLSRGTQLEIQVTLTIRDGDSNGVILKEDARTMQAMALGSLEANNDPNVIRGRIEVTEDKFTEYSSGYCVSDSGPMDLVLSEWGTMRELSRTSLDEGLVGSPSNGGAEKVCMITFEFTDVPNAPLYVFGMVGSGQPDVCRACVIGIIPEMRNADPVFPLGR